MKIKNILAILLLAAGYILNGCKEVDVTPLVYDDSSFTEVRMYLREIVGDHTSIKDLTVSSKIVQNGDSVKVVVKTDTDLTKLYAIAKLASGCTVAPVDGAPEFGTIADYSKPYTYAVKSANGQSREWKLTVTVAPPPPVVTTPTGFQLIRQDGTTKYIAFDSQFGELKFFDNKYYGHSYDGGAQSFSKLADDPDLNFKNTGDFSIAFRVRTTANNSDPSMMGTQDWNSSGNKGFTFAFRGNNWRVVVSDGSHKADKSTSGLGKPFNDGSWHLLVVTFDRDGSMTMYQDGEVVASADMSAVGNIDSGMAIHIAQDGPGNYDPSFKGDIAGTLIYNYVLTSDMIKALNAQ